MLAIFYIFLVLIQIAVYLAKFLLIVVINAAKLLFALVKVTFHFLQLIALGVIAGVYKIKEAISDKLSERRIAKRNNQLTA